MIVSFADPVAEEFYYEGSLPAKGCGWANVSKIAARKLDMLDAAADLLDLRSPPGNRLEALKGDLDGLYSIRINQQWRIIFDWTDEGPADVYIDDYH
jgi:proteic killer suppression protein